MRQLGASRRLARVKRVIDPYQDRREFVRLDRNEDPVGWAPEHFQAMHRSLTPYDFAAYSDSGDFLGKLANWLGLLPDNILVTSGSDLAIKAVFETYIDEGDGVLMQDPCWRMYEVYNNVYRGTAVLFPYDRQFGFPIGEVRAAIRERAPRLVILANPN